jgi:hypothetical protein
MDAAVRVKNQWLFEDVADRADAEQRGLEKLLDVIRADDIEFDVLLDPATDQQPDRVNTYVAFQEAAWSGDGDMIPMEGADFNSINAFGQIGFELRAFPRHGGKITTLAVLSRADLERLAFAAFQALGLEAVTFGPMPDGKPTGGFLEIGDCAAGQDTYPWEAQVELMLGSNGVVYAEVERSVAALPTLDAEGRAVSDEVGDLPKQLESVVHCPKCQGRNMSVVQVSCMEHKRSHAGRWTLDGDGFYWADGQRDHRDWSTDNEVAECDDCRERGDLSHFNFPVA